MKTTLAALLLLPALDAQTQVSILPDPADSLTDRYFKETIPAVELITRDALIVDVDGDGISDILLSATHSSATPPGGLRYYRGLGGSVYVDVTTAKVKAGTSYGDLLATDIDQDGNLDVFVGATLLRNNGVALIRDPAAIPIQSGVGPIALGDVDGDGNLDLFCGVERGTDQLFVGSNTGNFTREEWAQLPPDTDHAGGAAFADVDGDGDLDLFVAVHNSNAWVAVDRLFLNDGNGSFTPASGPQLPAPDEDSSSVAAGDVDGDGDVDFLVGTTQDSYGQEHRNRLWINDGSGRFQDQGVARLPLHQEHTNGVSLADLDGDGDLDALIANGTNHHWRQSRIYLNDGAGTFTDATASWIDPLPGIGARWATGDLDGDGDLDAVLPTGSDRVNSASVPARDRLFRNEGGRRFLDLTSGSGPTGRLGVSGLVTADFDGDGDTDLFGTGRPALLRNDGMGNFEDVSATALPASPPTHLVAATADVDGDGDLDLVLGTDWRQLPEILINDGTGAFTVGTGLLPVLNPNPTTLSLAAGDVDGDGDADLLLGNEDGTGVVNLLLRNDGFGSFTVDASAWPGHPGESTQALALFDFDGDGDLDLIEGNERRYSGQARAYRNNGAGVFVEVTASSLPAGLIELTHLSAADLDGDGDQDVVITKSSTAPRTRLLFNDGSGVFQEAIPPVLQSAQLASSTAHELCDWEGDGDTDLVVDDHTRRFLLVNDGSAGFTRPAADVLPAFGSATSNSDPEDLDGDGDADLPIADRDGVTVFMNRHVQLHAPRLACIAQTYALEIHADPHTFGVADAAVFGLGVRRLATPRSLPGLGVLVLDTNGAAMHWGFNGTGGAAVFRLEVLLPNCASCVGMTLHAQGLVLAGGRARLTNAVADRVH